MSTTTFLRAVNWPQTFLLAVMRVLAASLVWIALLVPMGIAENGAAALVGGIVGAPLFVGATMLCSLAFGVLSNWGVPFAGVASLGLSLVGLVGDPLVWILKKVRPDWVPVERFGLLNPSFVFVVTTPDAEF